MTHSPRTGRLPVGRPTWTDLAIAVVVTAILVGILGIEAGRRRGSDDERAAWHARIDAAGCDRDGCPMERPEW